VKTRRKETIRKIMTLVGPKMVLGEIGLSGVDWIGLAQDGGQADSSCECGNELSGMINAGKLSSGNTTGGLLSSAQLHGVNQ
jgi:hypothetical protein